MAKAFYTVKELAELLEVHEQTVYKLVRTGQLDYYKVGNQIRVPAAEIERLKVERKK